MKKSLSKIDINKVTALITLIQFCQAYESRKDLYEQVACYRTSLESLIEEVGECPTCGGILDAKKMIGGRIK